MPSPSPHRWEAKTAPWRSTPPRPGRRPRRFWCRLSGRTRQSSRRSPPLSCTCRSWPTSKCGRTPLFCPSARTSSCRRTYPRCGRRGCRCPPGSPCPPRRGGRTAGPPGRRRWSGRPPPPCGRCPLGNSRTGRTGCGIPWRQTLLACCQHSFPSGSLFRRLPPCAL